MLYKIVERPTSKPKYKQLNLCRKSVSYLNAREDLSVRVFKERHRMLAIFTGRPLLLSKRGAGCNNDRTYTQHHAVISVDRNRFLGHGSQSEDMPSRDAAIIINGSRVYNVSTSLCIPRNRQRNGNDSRRVARPSNITTEFLSH